MDITKKATLEDCIIAFASELVSSQNMLNQIDKVKWNNTDETFDNIKKLYDNATLSDNELMELTNLSK